MKCVVPQCGKELSEESAWLPSLSAMKIANKGQAVEPKDFPCFCLCGRHGHLLRKEGVKVFRYKDTVQLAEKREMTWRPFAEQFKKKKEEAK